MQLEDLNLDALNIYQMFQKIDMGCLIDVIAPCMDDHLYVVDLQNNQMVMSQRAVDRFMLPGKHMEHAMPDMLSAIFEGDRGMLMDHFARLVDGREKIHDLHYRWVSRDGLPVWINCRGVVVNDPVGKPAYLIGCLNETGTQQRANNTSGLLGGMDFCSYLRERKEAVPHGFLMHVGIDNFGAINGAYGSGYGDYILRHVAGCMTECLTGSQRVYHLVSGQFVIVDLESRSMDDAAQLRQQICGKIDEFIVAEKYEAVFSISVGVVEAATVADGYEECRKKFEFALNQAKLMGKNSIYFFEQKDYEQFLHREKILSALRNAVMNQFEGFAVYYQPIIDCSSGRIAGAEALMRFTMLTEAGERFVSPMEFIPILEETGLIIPAGRFVLGEAVKMCHELQQYVPDFKMNVNVSYVQIERGEIADEILALLRENDLNPACLCVEMTESRFVDMTPLFFRFRKKLEEHGIPFVIDDFGTGYSNLHCISDMNPCYIKLDKDFTAKAMSDAKDYELFKKIIEMVHDIGIKICTEGIEKEEWHLKMKELMSDYLQGYLFGRPCGKDQFMQQCILA